MTASSHLTSASVSGPAAPPAFPYAVRARDFPALSACRLYSAPAYPPAAGSRPYRGCRRGSTQARSDWHSRHRKAAHGLPVVVATGVATRKPGFLRGQRRVGLRKLAEYPSHLHRVTQCDHIVDRDSALLAGATSCTADPVYLNENRRPWFSSPDASQACKAGSSAARAASTEEQSADGSAISVSPLKLQLNPASRTVTAAASFLTLTSSLNQRTRYCS